MDSNSEVEQSAGDAAEAGASSASDSSSSRAPSEKAERRLITGLQRKFDAVTRQLNLDEPSLTRGWSTFLRVAGLGLEAEGDPRESWRAWIAASLVVVSDAEWNGLRLGQVLRAAGIKLNVLLQFIRLLIVRMDLDRSFRNRVGMLALRYTESSVTFEKFRTLWTLSLGMDNADKATARLFRVIWHVFIRTMGGLRGPSQMLKSLRALVAVLLTTLSSAAVDGPPVPASTRAACESPAAFLKLCQLDYDVDDFSSDVAWVVDHLRSLVSSGVLLGRVVSPLPEETAGGADSDATILSNKHLFANALQLERVVDAAWGNRGITELDERIFLEDSAKAQLGTPAKVHQFQPRMPIQARRLEFSSAETPPAGAAGRAGGVGAGAGAGGSSTSSMGAPAAAAAPRPMPFPAAKPASVDGLRPGEASPMPMTPSRMVRGTPGKGSYFWARNAHPPASPLIPGRTHIGLQTPIQAAVSAAQWVNRTLGDVPSEPTTQLSRFLRECARDPTDDVRHRVKRLATTLSWRNVRAVMAQGSPPFGDAGSSTAGASPRKRPGGVRRVALRESTGDGAAEAGGNGDGAPKAPVGLHSDSTDDTARVDEAPPATTIEEDDDTVVQVREMGVRLYYRVLEQMLLNESRRLKRKDFSSLLHNSRFHASLLATAIEAVVCAYAAHQFAFPAVMRTLGVAPCEMVCVVESFLRNELSLPQLLKNHLCHVEERLLEEFLWESNSPLFTALQRFGVGGRERRGSGSSHSGEEGAMWASGSSSASSAAGASPVRGLTQTAVKVIEEKVVALAARRVEMLTAELCCDALVVNATWTVFRRVLSHNSELLRGRHLDHVIMCSLFAVCRTLDISTSFSAIVDAYKKHRELLGTIIQNIPLSTVTGVGEEARLTATAGHGDIVEFHNSVFVPVMKGFVMRVKRAAQRAREGRGDGSPMRERGAAATDTSDGDDEHALTLTPLPKATKVVSPSRIGRTNVFVSPRKMPPPDAIAETTAGAAARNEQADKLALLMTPTTRAMYSFGESKAQELELINRAINRGTPQRVRHPARPRGALPPTATAGGGIRGVLQRQHPQVARSIGAQPMQRPMDGIGLLAAAGDAASPLAQRVLVFGGDEGGAGAAAGAAGAAGAAAASAATRTRAEESDEAAEGGAPPGKRGRWAP